MHVKSAFHTLVLRLRQAIVSVGDNPLLKNPQRHVPYFSDPTLSISVLNHTCNQPTHLPYAKASSIAIVHELVEHILDYADPATLRTCLKVNHTFHNIARAYISGDALQHGIRPMLATFREFYNEDGVDANFKRRRWRFYTEPTPASWQPFISSVGRYVRHLTLDIKSLVVSRWFLARLLDSCPSGMSLPKLETLHAVVTQDRVELDLVSRFFQSGLAEFTVDIWEPLPLAHRATAVMEREYCANMPSFRTHRDVILPPHDLSGFLEDVALKLPNIVRFGFRTRDEKQMLFAWDSFTATVDRLCKLEILEVPLYAAVPVLATRLCDHPTLQRIVAIDDSPTPASEPYQHDHQKIFEHLPDIVGHIPSTLTHLSVVIRPVDLGAFLGASKRMKHLRQLHIFFSEYVPLLMDVTGIFDAIADTCPDLEDLKMTPLMYPLDFKFRLSCRMLRPLTRCGSLHSIDIRTQYTADLDDAGFTQLVSHWPHLRRLALYYPDVSCTNPNEVSRLSLSAAMRALARYCPGLYSYSLYLTCPALPFDQTYFVSQGLCHIKEAVLGISIPQDNANSRQVARILHESLSKTCSVMLKITGRTLFELTEDSIEWESRHKRLAAYVKSIDLAYRRLAGPEDPIASRVSLLQGQ